MFRPAEVGLVGATTITRDMLGFPLRAGTPQEILAELLARLERREPTHIATLNPEIIERACRQPELQRRLLRADIFIADGIGLEWAARILRVPGIQRYPGIDLAEALLRHLAGSGGSVYLLGGKPGVAETAAAKLTARLPGLRIAGSQHGYYAAPEEARIAANIGAANADMLLVGMGFPKQEGFIAGYRDQLATPLMIGVGGALEVFAGLRRRAPDALRRGGLEWAWRSLEDIHRLKRLGVLPRFIWRVLREAGRRGRD